ncbi:putative exonuclease (plasmid) [Tolypothrix tenuis PCC 7101]|uniref:Nuclease SbcCD subunit D n=1 Tax=Tolypothrix tenuis PCC 7101 TaxID=231146 RepID=A0A1Z4NC90_9CYAN|nr:exonuclease SbcCD subunit D [Aulosira sp. FACHB-113]BAZ03348.1 putative exonuclease [Tolypothrix tenuis PCC 7101]BAZ78745.1 putative exonuclease [Aulosira laxa NIES-50]
MRILHTSDWHLGHKVNRTYDYSNELFTQIERICQLTEEHQVDVLLVAGDIFVRRAPEVTKHLAKILSPYVQRGLHIILLPGNHDDREHFRMMNALLSLEQGGSDRVHIVETREIFTIKDVQFAVIPYPNRDLLEPHRADATGKTERNVVLSTAYANLVRSVVDALDPSLPAVFVAHVNVAGVTTPSEKELSYDQDIRLGTADLPLASNLAYIALGHIHQQQQIEHPIPCWYSGNIERLDMGERKDDKSVLLVDVPPEGVATVTTWEQEATLKLDATPFHDITIPAAELETLPSLYPDSDRAFFKIRLELQPGDDPVFLQRRVRESCPRCLDVTFSGQGLSRTAGNIPDRPEDFATTVLEYLRQVYADDPDLAELEKRTNELMREVNDVITAD